MISRSLHRAARRALVSHRAALGAAILTGGLVLGGLVGPDVASADTLTGSLSSAASQLGGLVAADAPLGQLAPTPRSSAAGSSLGAVAPSDITNADLTAPLSSIYWGAYVGTQFTGEGSPWDMNTVTDFQNADAAGKGMSIVPFYMPFDDCTTESCGYYDFPSTQMSSVRQDGAIPLISWGSYSLADSEENADSSTAADPTFSLQDIIDGDYDSYLTAFAQQAKAWGHPFFLRFDWEMNGNWYPWSEQASDNRAGQFVAAWRHVHDIFTSVGATNASWVWCPNVSEAGLTASNLAELYPGDAYVDWTCLDGYNTGTEYAGNSWETPDQVFGSSYDQITQQIAPSKPLMIGEMNSNSDGGSQALWLAHALADFPTEYPDVHAVILFDMAQFAIEGNPLSQATFAAGINLPAYANNRYGSVSASPLPAP